MNIIILVIGLIIVVWIFTSIIWHIFMKIVKEKSRPPRMEAPLDELKDVYDDWNYYANFYDNLPDNHKYKKGKQHYTMAQMIGKVLDAIIDILETLDGTKSRW